MKFVCEIKVEGIKCGKTLSYKAGLELHQFKEHGLKAKGLVKCEVLIAESRECGMDIHTSGRSEHLKNWHKEVQCRSRECKESFKHKQLMLDHNEKEHRKWWACKNRHDGCPAAFKDKNKLMEHELECDASKITKDFVCKVEVDGVSCGKGFTNQRGLLMHHINGHHLIQDDGPCTVEIAPNRQCGMIFSRGYRTHHQKWWHQETKCRSSKCKETFPHNRLMLDHFEKEHKNRWKCKNLAAGCQSARRTKEGIIEHELTCDPSKKLYPCKYEGCAAKFAVEFTLKTHYYLAHSLNVLQVQEYLGIDDDEEEEEEEESDEESEEESEQETDSAIPSKKSKPSPPPQVPLDPKTGAKFDLFKFGQPKWPFQLLNYVLFQIFYHFGLRIPIFTYQLLFPSLFSKDEKKKKKKTFKRGGFRLDRTMLKVFRRGRTHYEGVGKHRGHLVRHCDYILLPITARDTNLYSNILPMLKNFNSSVWKRIENATAAFAKAHLVTIAVTVGLFTDPIKTEGDYNLPIPNRFAKVMLGLNKTTKLWDLRVYDVSHDESYSPDEPLTDLLGDLKDIEDQLKVQLFPNLKPEQLGLIEQGKRQQDTSQFQHTPDVINIK